MSAMVASTTSKGLSPADCALAGPATPTANANSETTAQPLPHMILSLDAGPQPRRYRRHGGRRGTKPATRIVGLRIGWGEDARAAHGLGLAQDCPADLAAIDRVAGKPGVNAAPLPPATCAWHAWRACPSG